MLNTTYKKIKVESRWDYLKIPVEDMPEGGLLFSGKDGWFLTNRDQIKLQHELQEYLDNISTYGLKEADTIRDNKENAKHAAGTNVSF